MANMSLSEAWEELNSIQLDLAVSDGHVDAADLSVRMERAMAIVATEREALLDIEQMTKPGSIYMNGTHAFMSSSHLTSRVHNRVRKTFGEEPLRWADQP